MGLHSSIPRATGTSKHTQLFDILLTIMQGVAERYDDLVVAVGSGGTVCGLALGNYFTGSKLKLVAIHTACNSTLIL